MIGSRASWTWSKQGNSSLVYSTYFGGSANEEVRGMAFDAKGNVIITGYTLSSNFPVTPDAVQSQYAGNGDAFVAVFNPSIPYGGGLLYSTLFGGSSGEVGYGVTSDSSGYLYVVGYTLSTNLPIVGTVPQSTWGGGTDLFVAKIARGTGGLAGLQFSTYLGSDNQYVPCGIAVGPDGRLYLGGYGGIGLPSSPNASQGGYAGGPSDGFLVVLSQPAPPATPQEAGRGRGEEGVITPPHDTRR